MGLAPDRPRVLAAAVAIALVPVALVLTGAASIALWAAIGVTLGVAAIR